MIELLTDINDAAATAFDAFDNAIAKAVALPPPLIDGKETTIGCSECKSAYCCMQTTAIFPGEAIYLASKYPVPESSYDEYQAAADLMENRTREEHFASATQCVFLDESKSCRIYDARPMCCRQYFVACEPWMCSPSYLDSVPALNFQGLEMAWSKIMLQFNFMLDIHPGALGTLPGMAVMASKLIKETDPRSFLKKQRWIDLNGAWAIDRDLAMKTLERLAK